MPRNKSEKELDLDAPLPPGPQALLFNGTTTVVSTPTGAPSLRQLFREAPAVLRQDAYTAQMGRINFVSQPQAGEVRIEATFQGDVESDLRDYSIELRCLEHDDQYAVYHVDVGVEYWYFEKSIAHAIAAHFYNVGYNEGIHDDDLDGEFSIHKLSRERADQLGFMGEDGQRECSLYEAGLRYGPGFIACSEY